MPQPIAAAHILAQAWRMMELTPPSSFADDSPQAQDASEQYPISRDMCLEDYDWSFARRLAHLAIVGLGPHDIADPDLAYAGNMPAEAVSLRMVIPNTAAFRLDGQLLRHDQAGGIDIRYTRRIDDETKLPATFQGAIAAQLAVLLMPRWVKSRSKRADLLGDLANLMAVAKKNDTHTASSFRSDGRPRQADWAGAATI